MTSTAALTPFPSSSILTYIKSPRNAEAEGAASVRSQEWGFLVRRQAAHGLGDLLLVDEEPLLQRFAEGDAGDVRAGQAHHRSVQTVECLFGDDGGDLRAEPDKAVVLVDDQSPVGFGDRLEGGFLIQRPERAQVHH